jgi:hypothetical protein
MCTEFKELLKLFWLPKSRLVTCSTEEIAALKLQLLYAISFMLCHVESIDSEFETVKIMQKM